MDSDDVEDKRRELALLAASALRPYTDGAGGIADHVARAFCEITAPEFSARPIGLIVAMPGGYGGATSTKPGNIIVNWRKLFLAGSEATLTAAGAATAPWLVPLAALVIWRQILSLVEIKIDEPHAAVLWALWMLRDADNIVVKSGLPKRVNEVLARFGYQRVTFLRLHLILRRLRQLRCIEDARGNKIWLCEWFRTQY